MQISSEFMPEADQENQVKMSSNPTEETLLVLSDNSSLSHIVTLGLESSEVFQNSKAKIIRVLPDQLAHRDDFHQPNNLALIVVALSSPTKDHFQVLNRASVMDQVGQTPILIISYHPFKAQPGEMIWYLEMPMNMDRFHSQLKVIANSKSEEMNTL